MTLCLINKKVLTSKLKEIVKIILTQNVENLGSLGDTVEVKPGYGRNYLIPHGGGLLATGKASKELLHRLQHLEKLREGKIALALEKAEKLKALKLEVTRKAGPGGRPVSYTHLTLPPNREE